MGVKLDIEDDLDLEEVERVVSVSETLEEISLEAKKMKESLIFFKENEAILIQAIKVVKDFEKITLGWDNKVVEINKAIDLANSLNISQRVKEVNVIVETLENVKTKTLKEINSESSQNISRVREVTKEQQEELKKYGNQVLKSFRTKVKDILGNKISYVLVAIGAIFLVGLATILIFRNDFNEYRNTRVDIKDYNKMVKLVNGYEEFKEYYKEDRALMIERLKRLEKGN